MTEQTLTCTSLDVVLGSFMTSWMGHHCTLGCCLFAFFPLIMKFLLKTTCCICLILKFVDDLNKCDIYPKKPKGVKTFPQYVLTGSTWCVAPVNIEK